MTNSAAIITIITALVMLALLGVALAGAAWVGGQVFRLKVLTFRFMLPIGLFQGIVAGFSALVAAQVLQLSITTGVLISVVLVLLIGLGELYLNLQRSWKDALKPWAVISIFQLVLGIPAALLLSDLLAVVLQLLFPPVY